MGIVENTNNIFPRMSQLLKPMSGERFSLIYDYVEDIILLVDNQRCHVVMSDSWQEREMCTPAVVNAHGDVLLLGFGIGLILLPIQEKLDVKSVTIIEKSQEVLDLVMPQLDINNKVRVIVADALSWISDMTFDFIWDDCDYCPTDVRDCEEKGIRPNNRYRLAPYLKKDGLYMRLEDDGRYRI